MMATVSKICPSTDGTLIYAEASGDPTNPSVVFAHGFLQSGIVFDKLFSDTRMLDKLYLVRYDMRGHGRSGKPSSPEGYASALFAADFSAVAKAFSLNMPVFVGWSAGASIPSDICSHISPVPISGAIAICGSLCMLDATKAFKPKLVDFLPKFMQPDSVATALSVRIEAVDHMFADPDNVPFAVKAAWFGNTLMQSPEITRAIMTGHQPDRTKLVELGAQGFPAMVIYATGDLVTDGRLTAEDARPHFTDLEVVEIQGGSHAPFYDNVDETLGHILSFCLRVFAQDSKARS
ncbi:alpha/beta-hydrolase [Mycena galericulata]|nr:alpha/beta-hydrolase [Mycena galericulata]